jgi:hypothetical protein
MDTKDKKNTTPIKKTKKIEIKDISDMKIDFISDIDLDTLIPTTEPVKSNGKISSKISETKYVRPPLTYTDKLSKQQVKELLIDYEQIKSLDDLNKVVQGTHLRYFEYKDNELKFRTGGILTISGFPDYLIMSSGKVSWSVQINKCIFFKRITIKQVREEFRKKLIDDDATIKGLHKIVRKNDKIIKLLVKKLEKYENVNMKELIKSIDDE